MRPASVPRAPRPAGCNVPSVGARAVALCLFVVLLALASVAVHADEPALLYLGAGSVGILDEHQESGAVLEYRPALRWHGVGPWVGFEADEEGAVFGAAGVMLDLPLGERWVVTPSFGGGHYSKGEGIDLGSTMQFRSAVELSYRFDNGTRLGLCCSHMSNGGINDFNPGTEVLRAVLAVPLRASK